MVSLARFHLYCLIGTSLIELYFILTATPASTLNAPLLRLVSVEGTTVSLAWRRSEHDFVLNPNTGKRQPLEKIDKFELHYMFNENTKNYTSISMPGNQLEKTLPNLDPLTEYKFQVCKFLFYARSTAFHLAAVKEKPKRTNRLRHFQLCQVL